VEQLKGLGHQMNIFFRPIKLHQYFMSMRAQLVFKFLGLSGLLASIKTFFLTLRIDPEDAS
jgi:hypothetical protein